MKAASLSARATLDLRRAAVHEAGHAVIAYYGNGRVRQATVRPTGDTLGGVRHGRFFSRGDWYGVVDDRIRHRLCRHIKVCYAGALAVKIAFPGARWRDGARRDFENAADLLLHIYFDGRPQQLLSELLMIDAENELRQYWPAVAAVAEGLLRHEQLSGREIAAAIHGAWNYRRLNNADGGPT